MRRRNAAIILCIALLGSCSDIRIPNEPRKQKWISTEAMDPTVVVYPRSDSVFWVYDSNPEFGVGSHLWEEKDLAGMRGLNARFIRNTMMWSQWHTGRAEMLAWWDFATSTNLLTPEFEPIVLVLGDPPGYGWKNREEAFDLLAKDLEWFASRYPQIKYYELFNEQNVGFGTLFGQHLHDWDKEVDRWVPYYERGQIYAQMLKKVYPAIKRANPDAWVIMGGVTVSYVDRNNKPGTHTKEVLEFIRGVYDAGGRDYFDIMNIHTYGMPLWQTFVESGKQVKELMKRYNDGKKPMMNTEFGSSAAEVLCNQGWPEDSLAGFDLIQMKEVREAYQAASETRLYWKVLPYQLAAEAEMHWCERAREAVKKMPHVNWDDYSHGFLRGDRVRRRPIYEWIAQYTAPLQPTEGRTTDIVIRYPNGDEISVYNVPIGVRYPYVLDLRQSGEKGTTQ